MVDRRQGVAQVRLAASERVEVNLARPGRRYPAEAHCAKLAQQLAGAHRRVPDSFVCRAGEDSVCLDNSASVGASAFVDVVQNDVNRAAWQSSVRASLPDSRQRPQHA
jgi:hypothetical protein